ncbi:MAG: dockerin type I repeat-containing protein [Clostridia bacterium]|nr:dockerin type I repeat-containing protein [Clostridia bacterium]
MGSYRAKNRKGTGLRLTALALVILMLTVSLPFGVFSDTLNVTGKKGSDFCTNTYIAGQLQRIFDLTVYSDYPYFTTFGSKTCGNTACTDCALAGVLASHPLVKDEHIPLSLNVYGSGAFARFAFYMIFGSAPSAINPFGNATADLSTVGRVAASSMAIIGSYDPMTVQDLKNVLRKATPGDIIQTRSSSGQNHTMIFLAAGDSTVTVLHSVDFQSAAYAPNRVLISEYSYSNLLSTWNQVISLLRAEDSVYAEAWAKGETHAQHVFTDAGQNFCTVCGVMVSPSIDVSKAGVFKAKTDALTYKGYYRSTGTAGKRYSAGSYVESVGTVVNSTGVPFHRLVDGSYVSGEDFTVDTSNTPEIKMSSGDYPTGVLTYGSSFNLGGTVTQYTPKLNYMTGYIIREDGTVASVKYQPVSYAVVYVKDCDINSGLKFSALDEGRYAYLLTARNTENRMSSFVSVFEVKAPTTKPEAPVPSAPTLSSKTATTVTLKSESGYEYKRENGSWQKSATFTGLTPNTVYNFYRRTAENAQYLPSAASAPLAVKTDKLTPQAPTAPVMQTKTPSSVTLIAESGYEYRIEGGSWQKSAVFTGLTANKTYTFYRRLAEDDYSEPSPSSPGLSVTTDRAMQATPTAPELVTKTDTTVTLAGESGYEYRREGSSSWQSSNVFTGLSPNTAYIFYRRHAATGEFEASAASPALTVTTDKGAGKAPVAAKAESVTDTAVRLAAVDGFEYRVEGGSWQSSPIFTGLSPAKTYKFYQRFAETQQYYAGASSGALTVTTDRTTQQAPAKPEVSSRTDTVISLKASSGCEYSIDGGKTWQTSGVFTGLISNTAYSFVCRLAATSTAYASPASEVLNMTTDRTRPDTPAAPVLNYVDGMTVSVRLVSGCEYSADNGRTWNKNGVFTFDSYGEKKIVCRVAVSDRTYASTKSSALTVQVLPKSLSSSVYAVDNGARTVSGVNAGTTLSTLGAAFAEKGFFEFRGSDGKTLAGDAAAATGMKIVLPGGEEYLISVRGDVSGDGVINVFDLAKVHTQILEENLTSVQLLAADADGSGSVNVFDYVLIRNAILNGDAL